ncbi:Serine/threonine-protein kinase pkn3 [Minicystis rosea]|nr:Serine/threonine-protein kinase pkn3 [Minicystis rosea]
MIVRRERARLDVVHACVVSSHRPFRRWGVLHVMRSGPALTRSGQRTSLRLHVIELRPDALLAERYRVQALLGEGGMGVVWAAEDIATRAPVALKLIKGAADDREARRRFAREARALIALTHPNVVQVREVFELSDGSPVLVMERLFGEPLGARLRRSGRLPLAEAARLLVPVISAVGAAHAQGIVHRDLKPENIFLCESKGGEIVKVLDFGIAKLEPEAAVSGAGTTTTGAMIGTPAYMAPEQVFGDRDLDRRVDVWALGIIAYQCLSGELPTAGEHVGQVLKRVVARPIPALAGVVPGLPREVSQIVDRMLAREREDRLADLREVHEVFGRHAAVSTPSFDAPAFVDRGDDREGAPLRRRRWRRLVPWLAGAAIVAPLLIGARHRPSKQGHVAPPRSAPLAEPTSVLACPVLRVSATDRGWLGAAAATIVCERARILMGGRPERTRIPAELLDLPRGPIDGFPADPYGAPDARERSLAAAKARSSAHVDGDVAEDTGGFRISLSVRTPDGATLSSGSGQGRGLYEAVREAMDPLVREGALIRAERLDPAIAEWSRTREVDAALALLDVQLAMANNAGGLPAACAKLEPHAAAIAELYAGERWRCAYTLGLPTPRIEAPPLDTASSGALAASARVGLMLNEAADYRDTAARMHGIFEHEPNAWGRAVLAATESCLLQSSAPERARELALLAVQADPRCTDGQLCSPWEQLLAATSDTSSAGAARRAMQAWTPWDSNAWSAEAQASDDPARALAYARRAYALTPFDTNAVDILANRLLASGEREEARSIALAVALGGHPVHRVESELVLVRIEASEARFGAAIERAMRALETTPEDGGYVRVQRIAVAFQALEAAIVVRRQAELADRLAALFIEPEPPPLDWIYTAVPPRAVGICALASKAASRRCFARLRVIFARGQFQSSIPGLDAFMQGAERYAEGDLPGAAAAWRPLQRSRGALVDVMPDAMAEAFERAGEDELAARIDAPLLARGGTLNGASLAHVRAARRARARGDRETARALATRVIEAWSVADVKVPAVAEMRALVAKMR